MATVIPDTEPPGRPLIGVIAEKSPGGVVVDLTMPPFATVFTQVPFSKPHNRQHIEVPTILRVKSLAVRQDPSVTGKASVADVPRTITGLSLGRLGVCFTIRTQRTRTHGSPKKQPGSLRSEIPPSPHEAR